MTEIVIAGCGLEGLIAAWVLKQHPDFNVRVVGASPIGGYDDRVHMLGQTEATSTMLRDIGVVHVAHTPHDGMLLSGKVRAYPEALAAHRKKAQQILNDWQSKAGLTTSKLNGELKKKKPKRRMRCEHTELVTALAKNTRVQRDQHWRLEDGWVVVDGKREPYDYAVITDPLWEVAPRLWFDVPRTQAQVQTVAIVQDIRCGKFRKWDRVMTPYTPEGCVFEVVDVGDRYEARVAGTCDPAALLSDLNFLFPDGYALMQIRSAFGALVPAQKRCVYPRQLSPLGKYAEWSEGSQLDSVLDGAYSIMRNWVQ